MKTNFHFFSGAYSPRAGLDVVRHDVAKYITKRDGVTADVANICLSNGASESIRVCGIIQLIRFDG
jgi:aspartate/methionine/tyrosine aminotransferase